MLCQTVQKFCVHGCGDDWLLELSDPLLQGASQDVDIAIEFLFKLILGQIEVARVEHILEFVDLAQGARLSKNAWKKRETNR